MSTVHPSDNTKRSNPFKFKFGQEESTVLSYRPQDIYVVPGQTAPEGLRKFTPMGHLDFSGDRCRTEFSSTTTMLLTYQSWMAFSVDIAQKVRQLNLKRQPCSDNVHARFLDCGGHCRALRVRDYCGCWPNSWSLAHEPPESADRRCLDVS